MKFQSESVDSYYLRSELQVAVHLCKRKDRMACEHLSNICALTLYTDGIACMLFVHTPLAPVWLFYNKQDTISILNDTKISERYSLRREDNSSTLDFTIAKFSLNGEFLSIGRPSLPCQLLRNVRFGVNYNKRCRTTAVELLNAQVELLSPYLIFKDGNRTFTHALPVVVKLAGEDIDEILRQQLVRKFFLVDNVSGFKALPTFMNIRFAKAPELSVLRYMKSLTVLVNVQNGEEHGKIFAPFLIVKYDELTYQDLFDNPDIVIEYKVIFKLKDSDMDYNVQITIGVLTGIALIFSMIKAWSYYKRNHNGNLSVAVLLWFLVYAMGIVGNVITFVCIGACICLFVFYKGQTVPYILLPDNASEKRIQTYMSVAFSFKIFNLESWMLAMPEANAADKFSETRNNFTLQYAICTFVYVSVYFAQWLIRLMFYERYIRNRLQKFVDLCSVANISVFILAHNYYGFYIHGRSVHGFADTDLPTLINDLKKEEDNLCAHRGLVPGTTEQTFIISLTRSFKFLYDELMKQKDNVRSRKFCFDNFDQLILIFLE
ncbi:Meckelin [Harpegnathos saltator]|uniref:Meckelin n=1 Tax=Harpegnathos saltator TaxID=610380 RepID=E2B8H1_HARSA|nr:Meckelin [Harpegnathos saltator]